MRAASADAQRAYMSLHRWIDLFLETPGIVLAVAGGVGTLAAAGFLQPGAPWPPWLIWKIACGSFAAAANLICVGFVLARWRAASSCEPGATPLKDARVRFWSRCVMATGVGVPAAVVALVLGLANAR